MKNIILKILSGLIITTLFLKNAQAQTGSVSWRQCLGGSNDDEAYSIIPTDDGGNALAGYENSNDGNLSENHGKSDFWVLTLNANHSVQWEKCFGGSSVDYAKSIIQIRDGSYMIVGYTFSNNGDVKGNHGACDCWIVKCNRQGDLLWQKCLGGSGCDCGNAIIQTEDDGFAIAGYTMSNDGDLTGIRQGSTGQTDDWIIKLDSTGKIEWQRCLGGSLNDDANAIIQTRDGGYAVAGYTLSSDGDITDNNGSYDFWVFKLNSDGVPEWKKCYGGSNLDGANSILQTADDGYLIAGITSSDDGDVKGNHGLEDGLIVKTDQYGNLQWEKCFGGSLNDDAFAITQNSAGNYVVAGFSSSNDGDVSGNHGGYDFWIFEMTSDGTLQWSKCLGGDGDDEAHAIAISPREEYMIAGTSFSNDGDVSNNHDATGTHADAWVVGVDEAITGIEGINKTAIEISVYPNPASTVLHVLVQKADCKEATLTIFNLLGDVVYDEQINPCNGKTEKEIQLSLPAGIYFVTCRAGTDSFTQRLVVANKM